MISNFRSQLEQQKAIDKLPEALIEVSRVREDLGWPPLVTPTSQIVGTQAVMNVLAGERYKMVPNEVKNYLRGQYGRPPAPVDKDIIKKILGDEIIDTTPKVLEPGLAKAAKEVDPKFIEHEEDIVSFAILPEPALEYFKWRAAPLAERPKIPVELELEKRMAELAGARPPAAPAVAPVVVSGAPVVLSADDYQGISAVLAQVAGMSLDSFTLTKGDVTVSIRASGTAVASAPLAAGPAPTVPVAAAAPDAPAAPVVAAPKPQAVEAWSRTVNTPIGGTFYTSAGPGKPVLVKVGDTVKAGDCVCVVEAMKLFNEITAPVNCQIVKLLVESGQAVEKDQPLVGIKEI
jgi:oxaloacetate decarboxylase alpha subunit